MQQKTTWMRYLLIGINLFNLSMFCSCEGVTEYIMTVDLEFINNSDSTIGFEIYQDISSNEKTHFVLRAKSPSPVFTYRYDGVGKVVTPENCCNSFLTNVYSNEEFGGSSKAIVLNDTFCVTHFNEKSTLIENYNAKIISDRHFRYTYVFDASDFLTAERCE